MTRHASASVRLYTKVFAALLGLTVLTFAVAHVDLGEAGLAVAMGIASFKAGLVLLYFMHLRSSTRLAWLVLAASVAWLGVLLVPTLADYFTRTRLRPPTLFLSPETIVRDTLREEPPREDGSR